MRETTLPTTALLLGLQRTFPKAFFVDLAKISGILKTAFSRHCADLFVGKRQQPPWA